MIRVEIYLDAHHQWAYKMDTPETPGSISGAYTKMPRPEELGGQVTYKDLTGAILADFPLADEVVLWWGPDKSDRIFARRKEATNPPSGAGPPGARHPTSDT